MTRRPILHSDSPRRLRGFTLIEVLLSLGLAAIVMAALATAIDVHLRCMHIGRTNVEEAQLARALLLRIGDDLRNAVVINPVDASSIPPAASETGDTEATAIDGGGSTDTTTDDMAMEEFETEDEYVLGLYGESDWMQVDVRRTPRLDQYDYDTLSSGSEILPDVVSGIKTVAYALHDETGMATTSGEYNGGLIRREVDHAVTRWAEDTGTLTTADQELEPIAPEVTELEFLYFDGTEWLDNWDSTEMGGLPIAVHVSLGIMPREQFRRFSKSVGDYSAEDDETVNYIYSLTVALPVADGGTSDEETLDDSAEVMGGE